MSTKVIEIVSIGMLIILIALMVVIMIVVRIMVVGMSYECDVSAIKT